MSDGRHEQMKYAKDGSIVQLLPKHQGYAAELVLANSEAIQK